MSTHAKISYNDLKRVLIEALESVGNNVVENVDEAGADENAAGAQDDGEEGQAAAQTDASEDTTSPELEDLLNSLLGDEYNAWKQYTMMVIAAKGKSLARVEEVFKNAGNEEMYDHFENLYKWMQSVEMLPMNDPEELDKACKCPYVKIAREQDTASLVKIAIEAEEAAILAYQTALDLDSVKTYPDLVYLLSEFLKDERGHLRELQDVQSQIEGFGPEADKAEKADDEEEVDDGSDDDEFVAERKMPASRSSWKFDGIRADINVNVDSGSRQTPPPSIPDSGFGPGGDVYLATHPEMKVDEGIVDRQIEKELRKYGITPEQAYNWQNATPEQRNAIVKGFGQDGFGTEDDLYKFINGQSRWVGGVDKARDYANTAIGRIAGEYTPSKATPDPAPALDLPAAPANPPVTSAASPASPALPAAPGPGAFT